MPSGSLTITRTDREDLVRFPVSSEGIAYEVTQLGSGRIRQKRTLAKMANFTATVGSFNVSLRTRGVFSRELVTLILPFDFTERARFWSTDLLPGGVFISPPGADHDTAYFGPTSYAGLSVPPHDLAAALGGEPRLGDPGFWNVRQWIQPDPRFAATVQHRLTEILSRLATVQAGLSSDATDFWQRSIVEAFAETALRALPPQREHPVRSYPSLVREVERYLDERADRPVHVSEICSALNVSRRALHRAFDDVLGIGPIAHFRRRRLHAAYSALRQPRDDETSVTHIAMEYGFTQLGRFAQSYKSLFGETPSQTLRSNRR